MNNKLLVCFRGNECDKTVWSGTSYSITQELKKRFIVNYVNITEEEKGISLFLRRLFYFVNSFYPKKYRFYIRPGWYEKKIIKRSIKKVNESNINLVFTNDLFLCRFIKNKTIVLVLDATANLLVNYYWLNWSDREIRFGEKLQKKVLSKVDKVVCASKWAFDDVLNHYQFKGKAIMAPFGANMHDPQSPNKNYAGKDINILFNGVEANRKGLNKAIEIVDLCNTLDTKHRYLLHVVGISGFSNANIDNVHFYGYLNKNNDEDLLLLDTIYRKAFCFLLPTVAECAGIVFCEAAMYSLPIISHDTGGVPTYVINGENGLLFSIDCNSNEMSKAIIELVKYPNNYYSMSNKSRLLYENVLNWNKWGDNIEKLIMLRND